MAGRANSSATRALASRCLTAWKLPIGLPNWWRSLAYAAAMASMRSASPTSSAAVPAAARSASSATAASAATP